MTFCSLGELCESTFNCNNQMSYFCTECTYSDSFSSVALCFVCPPRGSFTASLCSVLSWGARRHLVDDSRFCSISCPCWGLGKKSNGLRCFFLLASFQLLALVFKQKDAMDEGEGRAACVSANYILAKTHASLNSIMISNNVIGDIQASRKSTGDECSIIQRHERTHYHHVIMTWCLLWIMLIGFDSFGLLVFCACRLASGVVVLSSVWVRYHALLECSCLVRFSISCTACWELFCFGQFVFWYFFKTLVIVSNARRDGWLKTCSWMFESRVMDDFLFSWRVVWKYVQLQHSDVILCTEWTYSDSFSSTVLCMWHFVRFLVISRCDETLVATRASRSTRSSRSRLHGRKRREYHVESLCFHRHQSMRG